MAERIFFKSPEHKQRFLTAMLAIGKIYNGKLNEEYASAVYILTSSAVTWKEAESYVDRGGIDFEALLREVDFSGGYGVLIKFAGNLFNDRTACSPVDLMRLDDDNFVVALTALQVRRRALPVSELASEAELYNLEMDARNRATAENREKPRLPLQPGEEF